MDALQEEYKTPQTGILMFPEMQKNNNTPRNMIGHQSQYLNNLPSFNERENYATT